MIPRTKPIDYTPMTTSNTASNRFKFTMSEPTRSSIDPRRRSSPGQPGAPVAVHRRQVPAAPPSESSYERTTHPVPEHLQLG